MKVAALVELLQSLPQEATILVEAPWSVGHEDLPSPVISAADVLIDWFGLDRSSAHDCWSTMALDDSEWDAWLDNREAELESDERQPRWWQLAEMYRGREENLPLPRRFIISPDKRWAPAKRAAKKAAPAKAQAGSVSSRTQRSSVPPETFARSGYAWEGEGDQQLRDLTAAGRTTAEIAGLLGRSIGGVRQRARKVGVDLID